METPSTASASLSVAEHDVRQTRPDIPQLELEVALGAKLTEESNCSVLVIIRRRDLYKEPCVIRWSQEDNYCFSKFLLFRHSESGLMKIDIDDNLPPSPPTPFIVDDWKFAVRELAPGGKAGFMTSMPARYRKKLVKGFTYELVWPGDEIALWDWGTVNQHRGHELSVKSASIHIPRAQATLEFDKFGKGEERRESPPPIALSERIPGAPKLRVVLECDQTVPEDGKSCIKISVIYEAPPGSPPIIFHTTPLRSWSSEREGYRLYRQQGDIWETVEEDSTCFMILDNPDVTVNVSQHDEYFTSLEAGQSWTTLRRLEKYGSGILPDEAMVGDVFRYVFKGVVVDWWDWGNKSNHSEAMVKLPCWLGGRVLEPKDNDGRPKLMVPASNCVQFAVV